ncbi:MAG: hypothetical protein SRB2_01362 [Desulfobacteraceae bacterium Eth-SRB2]|nr:MAG: hypothetical protein SRB2_01362 [Desulfobacteraceae bacterium Eth-SRB2]
MPCADLSSKLVDAQNPNGNLYPQELHDSIGGKLTAIKYSLENDILKLICLMDLVNSLTIYFYRLRHRLYGKRSEFTSWKFTLRFFDDLGL